MAEKPSPELQAEAERLQQQAAILQQRRAAMRLLRAKQSREDLVEFTKFTMPHPEDPDNAELSRYDPQYFHRALAAALQEVEKGAVRRLIVTFPPRHGKSALAGKSFPSWFVGRDPYRYVAVCTYNQPFADDYGKAVRAIMRSSAYGQVFPGVALRKGSQASDRLETEEGGALFFVGRGGTITGRGADLIIVDDPLKNSEEANSETTRNQLWEWFNSDIKSRFMSDLGVMIVIQCMTGDTPVLMADGHEKPLMDIRVGDEIATFEAGKITTSTVRNWANQGPDRVFTIRMKSGITVRANARHPFLVVENGEEVWRQTGTLKKGSVILRATGGSGAGQIVRQKDVTSQPSARVCACRTTASSVGKRGLGPLPSILALVAKRISGTVTELTSLITNSSWLSRVAPVPSASNLPRPATPAPIGMESSASIIATIAKRFAGFSATTAILRSDMERPLKFSKPPLATFAVGYDVVEEVTESGIEDVYDIQVDRTENFIANGLVSHNTRWHEDDLVGRLTDPGNPHYNADEAASWKIINIPAIAEEDDVLGREPGAALWPERFGIDYLLEFKRNNPKGFSALYQQRPTPEDGDFFQKHMIVPYKVNDIPKNLRIYAASDHAVGIKQEHDRTCLLIVGVDDRHNIWLLDCWWQRKKTDVVVDAMIAMMKRWKPLTWWAENGHISKSIGPFLFKRMQEEKVYVNVVEQTPSKDKSTRAQSIQGRMSMGMVRFPNFEPWYDDACQELLKFPQARHDDFVDTLAHIGLGLDRIIRGAPAPEAKSSAPRVGTLAWVKHDSNFRNRQRKIAASLRGM